MKIENSDHRGDPSYTFQIFSRPSKLNFSFYIKTNSVFGLTKYSCIRIDKNILGNNNLFSMKIKNSDHCIHFRFFQGCQSSIFSVNVFLIVSKK